MMERIVEIHNNGFKIKVVLQVGDITDRNTIAEWESARSAFSKLDTITDYIFCTGNHDYGDDGTTNNRNTSFNNYFQYRNTTSFVESYREDNYENTFFKFSVQGHPFILFSLEYGPRNAVVAWADSIARRYSDKYGILLTHAYLTRELERYNYTMFKLAQGISPYTTALNNPEFAKGKVNDGQEVWDKLLFNNNFRIVVCGHRNAEGKLISANQANQEVLQLIFAEHNMPKAVEGWVQILEFYKDKKTMGVKTYSTLLNTWKTDSTHQYDFTYHQN
jgi:hypothetical protein